MRLFFLLSIILTGAAPAAAGWKIMPAGTAASVVDEKLTVTPSQRWNRWSSRPSDYGEIWTIDGLSLNELSFFAGIPSGKTIYHDRQSKRRPLPKFRSNMLLTDIVELFESTNRIVLQTSLFEVGETIPAKLSGHDAVRFRYSYAIQGDELKRNGEAVAAIVDGKLYLVNFVAPAIHYFDRDIDNFQKLVDTIKIGG
ncbi:MAG: hypothetical protein V3V15_07855 [Sphingorhabdus sp.]